MGASGQPRRQDGHGPRTAALVTRAVALLMDSGQPAGDSERAVARLNELLGTRYRVLTGWSQVMLLDDDGAVLSVRPIHPVSTHMGRATAVTRALAESTGLDDDRLESLLDEAEARPVSPTWLFVLAAGGGAALLSIIFGADHPHSIALIFAAAALGGLARRLLAGRATPVAQVFVAALIGGLAGSLSVHLGWTSSARLVAVCPAMVLVPGPQVLSGAIAIAERRHDMGLARLSDAGLTILATSAGLLAGLMTGGADLPVSATTRPVPAWLDIACGAAVAVCYPVYFSMPAAAAGWALLAGGLGHAAHWAALSLWGWNAPAASLAACAVVSTLLTPVCRARRIPFAGAGFAAVVALVPGVYLFRSAAGALDLLSAGGAGQDTLLSTAADLSTAVLIILGMAVGLVVPHRLWRRRGPGAVGPGTARRG